MVWVEATESKIKSVAFSAVWYSLNIIQKWPSGGRLYAPKCVTPIVSAWSHRSSSSISISWYLISSSSLSSYCWWAYSADAAYAADALMLLIRWCANTADVLILLMLLMRWCADAADVLILLMSWCCWCTNTAEARMLLMLLMRWCDDAADVLMPW